MENENKKPENPVLNRGAFGGTTNYTLRDYFAAKAMQAMCTSELVARRDSRYDETNWDEVVAANSYEFADAMLKEREK